MPDEGYQLFQLLKQDSRYTIEAYQFVREALAYAQEEMDFSKEQGIKTEGSEGQEPESHLTGQQLCEAVRVYALDQYGYMAKAVLNSWGLVSTGSVGDIVYNLIEISWMKKSENDSRDHFDGVYDFKAVFQNEFEITLLD